MRFWRQEQAKTPFDPGWGKIPERLEVYPPPAPFPWRSVVLGGVGGGVAGYLAAAAQRLGTHSNGFLDASTIAAPPQTKQARLSGPISNHQERFENYDPQERGWPLPSSVWKLEPQAHDFVAFGLKIEKPLFMMSST